MASIPSKQYLDIKARYPAFMDAVEALGKAAKEAGPIDDKTAHLIQLAAAAAGRSEGAVHSHVRRALEAGAGADEILHAILLLTSTIGFPNMVAALSWAEDVFADPSRR